MTEKQMSRNLVSHSKKTSAGDLSHCGFLGKVDSFNSKVDLMKPVSVSVRPFVRLYTRLSVRPLKIFSDLNEIWYVGTVW